MKSDKKTKGLVPKLRFPEFRDAPEWKIERLSKISSRVIRKAGNLKVPTLSISAGKGFVTQTEKFGRNISGAQYKNYILLEKGDFAYNKGNSKQYPQGCIYQLEQFDEAAVPNAFICFCFRKNYVAKFFLFYFENNCYGEQLKRYITSGARSDGLLNISADDFFSILIPVSEIREEQQKIADCLSSIDELIKLHSQKLEQLKDYKKGLMQQLFPAEGEEVPKLRFSEFRDAPEWECDYFNKIFSERNKKHNKGLQVLAATQDKGVIPWALMERSIIRDNKNLDHYKLVSRNDFVISLRTFEGGIEYSEYEGIISPAYTVIFPHIKINDSFFRFLFKSERFIQLIKNKLNNSLRDGKTINYKQAAELRVIFPKPDEQQKIADCLSSIDELITSQTRKIESLKEHKKGLMQQLFPSSEKVNV